MSPDRYGESNDKPCRDPRCGNGCPKRWLGWDDEGRPIPCLVCKDHLLKGTSTTNDSARTTPSASARAAIDADNEQSPKT